MIAMYSELTGCVPVKTLMQCFIKLSGQTYSEVDTSHAVHDDEYVLISQSAKAEVHSS